MKLLVGKFVLESNANIPIQCDLENTDIRFGQECLERMQIGEVFKEEDIEVIPTIYADAAANGVMKKSAFDYIENRILNAIKEHLSDLDGIYLHLHGASEIEEIGSGDHHIIKKVRELVGPYMPIGVVCDPHGNLCQEYVEATTIIRSFRESPHTDIPETVHFVCNKLKELIRHRQNIMPVYRKLPMILGGEQSVSTDEPVRTINQHLNELEEDPRILSCSWHVGYIRHDCPVAGCGIVVVPSEQQYQEYANQVADELAEYVFNKRHEFHYTGLTAQPDQALKMALEFKEKPVFITDSGDNVTSGSVGANTFVLRQVLAIENLDKKILFAAIHDPETYQKLQTEEVGTKLNISLGMALDELSEKVELTVIIKGKSRQVGTKLFAEEGDFGGCVKVSVEGYPIDILVTDTNHSYVEQHQFLAADADWNDYDICVVKIGYAFPELIKHGKLCVMSLTKGATLQDTASIPFKQIMRPMFPIDKI